MPPEWEQGSYGAPSYRVGTPQSAAPRQRPYADAPLGTRTAPHHPGQSPYGQPAPESLPRRGPGNRPRPNGNGNGRNGNGNGNGRGGGGRGGGRGPNGPQGRGGRRRGLETEPQKTKKRRRNWKQRSFLTLGVLVIMGCLAGATVGTWAMWKLGQVTVLHDVTTDTVAAGDPINYLIVGNDTREGETNSEFGGGGGGGADTMMVVRLDPETMAASIISFPRDLIVPIAGGGEGRLNSAFTKGHQVLVDTLKQNFAIEINRYVVVDFAGFQRLVDSLGGVEMFFDRQVKDENTGLGVDLAIGPGCVTLDGHQGLAYARSRKLQYMQENGRWSDEDPFADLGRIDRQRVFIEVALAKALSQATNPARLLEMVNIGVETIQVDENSQDLLALAEQFKGFDLANLTTYSLPVLDNPNGDGATLVLKDVEAEPILNIFRGLDPSEISPGRITVQVHNGTAVDDQALNAGAALQTVGFKIGERTSTDPHPLTTIYHNAGEELLAQRVARHVTGGAVPVVNDDLPEGTVRLVTGDNFTTIHQEPTPVDQMPGVVPPPPPPETPADSAPPATEAPPPVLPPESEVHEYTFGGPCP